VKTTIKNAYEKLKSNTDIDHVFANETDASPSELSGEALRAFSEYVANADNGTRNDFNGAFIKSAVLPTGQKIFIVAGDVSDTGSQVGFYDSNGALLKLAYMGQGAHPNAKGVDWLV
jgi:hypothetical protein